MKAVRTLLLSPHLFLGTCAVLWAGHHIVTRGTRDQFTPAGLAFWRWALALLVLGAIAGPGAYRKRELLRGQWLKLLFFGVTGTGVYNIFTYAGIQLTTATNAFLIHSLTPTLIPLFAWLIFRERIRPMPALGLVVSFLGVLAIVTRLDPDVLSQLEFNRGDLWILGSAILWALYTVCLRIKPAGLTQMEFLLLITICGLVPLTPIFLLESAGPGVSHTLQMALAVTYLAVFLSVVTYSLWSMGVHAIGSTLAGIYMNLVPVLGIAMAIALLGERPQVHHVVGFILIVAGIWLASRRWLR